MMKLRINPFVVTDLKEICDYIAEDNAMRSIMRSGCVRGGDRPCMNCAHAGRRRLRMCWRIIRLRMQ